MSKKTKPPRLYQEPKTGKFIIRDGKTYIRTGCNRDEYEQAEKQLAQYLGQKYEPKVKERNPDHIPIDDVLLVYVNEHVVTLEAPLSTAYSVDALAKWWSGKKLANVAKNTCRAYQDYRMVTVKTGTVRRELATLNAAIQYWHESYGPLSSVPIVTLPPASPPRERWLTESEAAALLGAALGFYRDETGRIKRSAQRINRHLARMILLGLYTGSRRGVLLSVAWDRRYGAGYIDLERGVMHRRSAEAAITKKRKPPVKLGRKILAHLRRWHRRDQIARQAASSSAGVPVKVFETVVSWNGQPLQSIRSAWEGAVSLAGLDAKVTPHTLRHTRATWMMQHGVPIYEAAGALGMTVKTLEDVYGHHHPDFQAGAAEV